jgi:hypothetical protein
VDVTEEELILLLSVPTALAISESDPSNNSQHPQGEVTYAPPPAVLELPRQIKAKRKKK